MRDLLNDPMIRAAIVDAWTDATVMLLVIAGVTMGCVTWIERRGTR
jgi:uncharacterized membrane protein